jgi:CubicO group peptidase (beta-lactamase class C family)
MTIMSMSARLMIASALLVLALLASADDFPMDEPLAVDTPATTVAGNTFTAPAEWRISVKGPATIITAPEGGSQVVYVDIEANDAESAMDAAWAAYKEHDWPLKIVDDVADSDGWTKQRRFEYQTSPNERRFVSAGAMFANDKWTVWIYDVANDVSGKRGAQINLLMSSLLPQGYEKETFAGMTAHRLDDDRLAALTTFVERGLKVSGVPGASVAIIQDGEVIFSGGFGVRELGKPEEVDGDTLYMIASNSKGLTTLLLAKLVDDGEIDWKDRVVDILPGFKLGDDETTSKVLVEHLVCACTGLPRQDMEWILEFGAYTPESSIELLGTMQPTSGFGEMFQYSNVLAAAGGFVAGHVVHPEHDLGTAYDKAMQSQVFDPLDMTATTFDFKDALAAANHARPHSVDVNGDQALAVMGVNYAAIPVRPAAAAWSSVNDLLKYVAMELAVGKLPNGERYIGEPALLERREPMVPVSEDHYYGMGLMVDESWGVPVVHHGGDMIGFHSDMMWLPDHGVGAVVLTNGDPGWLIRSGFRRKLLEVLFDGNQEADELLRARSEQYLSNMAVEFELLKVPADTGESTELANYYRNTALGDIVVSRADGVTTFDFGEWKSEVGSRDNPDGTVSFMTTAPGIAGLEFVVGSGEEKTLITRDAQHEYVFDSSTAERDSLAHK